MDAGSKWIEAAIMNNTSTQSTLSQLLLWFTRFGFPKSVHSDNGPQFANPQFESKLLEWVTSFSRSPPYHPQSNSQVERAVRIVKDLCWKTPNLSLDELLFSYRATPLVSGKTLAELLLSRTIRTRLDGYLPQHSRAVKSLSKDMPVWCKSYQPKGTKWIPGSKVGTIGNVLWTLKIGSEIRTRHINQLHPRKC
nr:uncharacterized protein K02A2.6-like [Lepeophtheirus salmonis]